MSVSPIVFSRHACLLGRFAPQDRAVSISCDVMNLQDTTPYRVYVQFEAWESVPYEPLIANHGFYDLILAWNESVLAACSNAMKFASPAGPCCGAFEPGVLSYRETAADEFLTMPLPEKKFGASFLVSEKQWWQGHVFRHAVYPRLGATVGCIPVVKHRAPPHMTSGPRAQMIATSQYCITVECVQYTDLFTEKITDCFLTRTIPLYRGCPTIQQYFNMDGVIRFQTYEELVRELSALTPESYAQRADAIEDNYQRALEYKNVCSRVDKIVAEHVGGL
jgi:hypothetical protein